MTFSKLYIFKVCNFMFLYVYTPEAITSFKIMNICNTLESSSCPFVICFLSHLSISGLPDGSDDQCTMPETGVLSLGWEDILEKGMATQSSILAWRIPWTEEPGGIQSMRLQRVRHNWMINVFTVNVIISKFYFLNFIYKNNFFQPLYFIHLILLNFIPSWISMFLWRTGLMILLL